jgi:glycine hydroxymethyltransferase
MMALIASLIERVLNDPENEENLATVRSEVNSLMAEYPLFAW